MVEIKFDHISILDSSPEIHKFKVVFQEGTSGHNECIWTWETDIKKPLVDIYAPREMNVISVSVE